MRTVVIGGTSGIGLEVARTRAARGDEVVLTGRDRERSAEVAKSVEGDVAGLAVDLNDTHGLADALAGVGTVDRLVIAAIERDQNSIADYHVDNATKLAVAQAGGVHRGDPHPAAADERRLVDRALRRPGQGPALPRVDHGLDGQRRHRRPGARPWPWSWRRSGSTPCIRASSATARSGRASPKACSTATSPVRRPGGSRRWRTSSTASEFLLREPRRHRHQPPHRRWVDGHMTSRCASRSSAPAGWAAPWRAGWRRPGIR